jgi:branched-chain amino acid transport system ATP-binding protein
VLSHLDARGLAATSAGPAALVVPVLELGNVSASYGRGDAAIRSVNLRVEQGQVVGLLGANGAGKSTTLRAISGVIGATGQVLIDGDALVGTPERRARRGVAHVPEGRQIIGTMTVSDNLLLGHHSVRRRDRNRGQYDTVLELFPELRPLLNRAGAWLSGGEQQMLAIGRALMAQPRLMLLDEPTMGLAPIVVERLAKVLQSLHQLSMSVLVAEENLGFAADVASECYVLRSGQVAWSGTSSRLKSEPGLKSLFLS